MLDRKTLIRNFTIGFIPLLIFIVADEFFGLTAGLITAISYGILQAVFTYFKEKRIDKFVLFDTTLILLLGLISLILHNDVFFKIKPGLIELILVILLGVTAFSSNPILIRMTGRYLKGIEFSADQMSIMQKMMRRMFYLFSGHTILIFYAAFYLSKESWAFISGGLFYILMGLIFVMEYAKSRWTKIKFQKSNRNEEWFDIVKPDGQITGRAPRSAVHGNPDLLHPVVHVHIINAQGQIFLQKRSKHKEIQPGKWDTAIGGHIKSGESVEQALRRESEEEQGISMANFHPLFRYVMKNEIESELVHGFLLQEEGPFYPNPVEIEEARFWTRKEIDQNLGKDVFTPNFEKEYQLLKKIVFKEEEQSG
jgi:isopentenyldiphosphate isomerase/intracellular septation protein A